MAFQNRLELYQAVAAREGLNTQPSSDPILYPITLGVMPPGSPKLNVSAPLSIPLLSGVTFAAVSCRTYKSYPAMSPIGALSGH